MRDTIIEPLFINGNLNGEKPKFTGKLNWTSHHRNCANTTNDLGWMHLEVNTLHYQQDGTPHYYAITANNKVKENCISQWIERKL